MIKKRIYINHQNLFCHFFGGWAFFYLKKLIMSFFIIGLFPLFSSAAMNVRSALLMIYENHFVPLGPRLRPGLNGFLAATLSGLEEGSDHFER